MKNLLIDSETATKLLPSILKNNIQFKLTPSICTALEKVGKEGFELDFPVVEISKYLTDKEKLEIIKTTNDWVVKIGIAINTRNQEILLMLANDKNDLVKYFSEKNITRVNLTSTVII